MHSKSAVSLNWHNISLFRSPFEITVGGKYEDDFRHGRQRNII